MVQHVHVTVQMATVETPVKVSAIICDDLGKSIFNIGRKGI